MDNDKADKIIDLLQEIKDLQQQHISNYQVALRNQEESIAIQKNAMIRVRRMVVPLLVVVLVLIIIVVLMLVRLLGRYFF